MMLINICFNKRGSKKYWPKKCKSSYLRDLSASPISTSNWFIDYTCTCRCLELYMHYNALTYMDRPPTKIILRYIPAINTKAQI